MAGSLGFLRAGLAVAVLTVAATTAQADSVSAPGYGNDDPAPSAVGMAADLVVARPLGLAATVLGTAVFVVSLPFAALAGNVRDPARRLVAEPFKFTFTRPLGAEPN